MLTKQCMVTLQGKLRCSYIYCGDSQFPHGSNIWKIYTSVNAACTESQTGNVAYEVLNKRLFGKWDVAQLAGTLPTKHKALGSNPSTT